MDLLGVEVPEEDSPSFAMELVDDESSVLSEVGSVDTEKSFSIEGKSLSSTAPVLSSSCRFFMNFGFKLLVIEDEIVLVLEDCPLDFDRFFLKKGMIMDLSSIRCSVERGGCVEEIKILS